MQENAFENVVCEMVAISSQSQCVDEGTCGEVETRYPPYHYLLNDVSQQHDTFTTIKFH